MRIDTIREKSYGTENSNYPYYVQETKDMVGDPYYAVIIPPTQQKIRRSCGKWPNNSICREVLDDFGLVEERREYRDDGRVVVYGT